MSFLAGFLHRHLFVHVPEPTASWEGKTVIITGSNTGLGLEASRLIVRLGAQRVIMACRNIEKGKAAAGDIVRSTGCSQQTLEVWELNMSSYESVQAFAKRANVELSRLDAVLANAAIMTREFRMTEDNEETITTNVVSTTLLSLLLYPKLSESAKLYDTQSHLTLLASELHKLATFKERKVPEGRIFATLNNERTANMADRYNVSKLITILIAKHLGEQSSFKDSGVIVNVVCPGFCKSELRREYDSAAFRAFSAAFARTTEVGGCILVNVLSAGSDSHGRYLPDCKMVELTGMCRGKDGDELQDRIWKELSKKLEHICPGVTATW
ncbi:putative short-chain dehydrogenase [Aaosphaeria arxii CBS 175.79]|uniref:Putative short-chain dehydrogenase n=1 Tax=Aaosphaeria arxii CBS 175.79 TaxID=1450172 RepID=A0A6A5X869_9PLEO|nr:putative short-chain dehydrogenase [Aaosphaeria arxii CBS 175.79]KAF2009106.1 putative short-chain dehydrogenase [Aaosphaeria arxii CBS 175.79]